MMFGRGYNGFNNCFGYGSGFTNSGIGLILMLGLILLAAAAVILLITRNNRHKLADDALETLKIRLAKGEISEDEYMRRKNLID